MAEEGKQRDEFLRVKKIENGIVIDHIPQGKGTKLLEVLGVGENFGGTVSMLMNVPSSSFGLKDVIKIEGKHLKQIELEKVSIIAPFATINIVKNFEVVEKYKAKLPEVVEGVVKCPNPTCISGKENISKMMVKEHNPLKLKCHYCEKVYGQSEFLF